MSMAMNIFYKKLIFISMTAIFIFLFSYSNLLPILKIPSIASCDTITEDNNVTDDLKHILIWSMEEGRTMEESYEWKPGRENFIDKGCEENRCVITGNRSARPIYSFDAIIFNQRSFQWTDVPSCRKNTQKYVHYMDEAPMHLYYDKTSLKTMDNLFNWTLTYRMDSSFPIVYGALRKEKAHPVGTTLKTYISSFGANNTHLAKYKNSSAPIAWFVSNCHSESNREKLVKELQKYIKVDVYGGCGTMKCPKSQSANCLQKYKFYLSLENAVCRDYITEKFFSIAKHPIIPITLNGLNMAKLAPPHSYINVLDFPTVKDLANYLIQLTQNDTMYASYFWWKDFYSVSSESFVQGYCDLCRALHEKNSSRTKAPSNMYKWWVDDALCYKPTFT